MDILNINACHISQNLFECHTWVFIKDGTILLINNIHHKEFFKEVNRCIKAGQN